ncbi:hypothetical protein CYB_0844 [Synechococcus sp. JA-2-3B'a(2-13)]|nr:hypothetical protein CYB_0844 [Synechococcus sp. JA-2-3B'a(2-13)]
MKHGHLQATAAWKPPLLKLPGEGSGLNVALSSPEKWHPLLSRCQKDGDLYPQN